MPRPLISPLGKRQPRALVVGLRRVVKDPCATVAERLEACKLLAIVEGYLPSGRGPRPGRIRDAEKKPQGMPELRVTNAANANRLRELLRTTPVSPPPEDYRADPLSPSGEMT
jgi:hypothetical protein